MGRLYMKCADSIKHFPLGLRRTFDSPFVIHLVMLFESDHLRHTVASHGKRAPVGVADLAHKIA